MYLTGDLRHHVVDEHLREGGPALVDAAHWALEVMDGGMNRKEGPLPPLYQRGVGVNARS